MTSSQQQSDARAQLVHCPSPLALLELMAATRMFRDNAWVIDLRSHAISVEKSNGPLAQQVDLVAAEMEAIFKCIDTAPGDGTLAALNTWLAACGHAWLGATKRLLLAAARDARIAGDLLTRRRLVTALLTFRRLERFTAWVIENVSSPDLLERIEAREDVSLVDYVEWLRLRGQVPDEYAPRFLWLREYITTLKRIRSTSFTPAPRPGWVRTSTPVTDGVAHAWFVRDPGFFDKCKARVVAIEEEAWAAIVVELTRAFFEETDWELYASFIKELGGAGEAGVRIHATTVVCEVALMHGPIALTEAVLTTYRDTITSRDCVALPRRVWETHVYHYVYGLVRMWSRMRDPKPVLEAAIELGEEAIAGADIARAPRLIRDMYFACARLYERLAEWDRNNFQRAISHYREGLAVEALKGERDPRARALADLANTLYRAGRGSQEEIEALYKEALRLRPVEESSSASASSRLNYAIFLFEQVGTTVAKAHALELLEQAETAFPGMDPEVKDTPWGKELLASIWMTRGNILREEGSEEAIKDSLQLYEKAARFIGEDPWFRPIRTHLLLNRCFVHLDLHELTDKDSELVAADMMADEACGQAIDAAAVADARLCKALVGLRAGEPPASLLQTIEECLQVTRFAGGIVRSLSALAWRARVGMASGKVSEIAESRRLLREGMETALNSGLYFEYLQHARGFANASVVAWRLSNETNLLAEAIDALEQVRSAIEAQLAVDVLVVDPDSAHAHLAAVAAELAWLRVAAGGDFESILSDVTIAKGPDTKVDFLLRALVSSLASKDANDLSALRQSDWRIRRDIVQRERVDAKLTSDVSALRSAEERRAISIARFRRDLIRHQVRVDEVRPEVGIVIDVTVCRWGSVIIALSNSGEPAMISAPFSLSAFQHLQQSWFEVYVDSAAPPRSETEGMLGAIEHDLLGYVSDLLASASRVVFIPHVLAGVPLHAARLHTGKRVVEITQCIAYAVNILAVNKRPKEATWLQRRVLCLALDPGGPRELVNARAEVAATAKMLVDSGAEVIVVADSGGTQGRNAFTVRGVSLDARVRCENPMALSSWISEHLPTFDHVLVASHGAYGSSGGSILLPREEISILDLLATSEVKPGATIHLSACETAMRVGHIYSLAWGMFHLGAAFVLGTCWRVRDRDALIFSGSFYKDLTTGTRHFEQASTVASLELRRQVGDSSVEFWSPFLSIIG